MILGSQTSNAGSQGALDALSMLGQSGPKMPDFSGAQFGGVNNPGAAAATNPFAMSGAAGAAASKLPTAMSSMGQSSGGGMAGLSGSINQLIASNNKLVAALNKLASSMGTGAKTLGGFGPGSMGGGGGDPMGVFEQLNLQKGTGATGGFPSGGRGGGGSGGGGFGRALGGFAAGAASDFTATGNALKQGAQELGMASAFNAAGNSALANALGLGPTLSSMSSFMAKQGRATLTAAVGSGAGTDLASIANTLPAGYGAKTAQHISVLDRRLGNVVSQEYGAFKTATSIGMGFGGVNDFMTRSGIRAESVRYGLGPTAGMEQLMDVYTTGGFRTGDLGGVNFRGETGLTVDEIFRYKEVGYGSTVMGNIQELNARGSGLGGMLRGQSLADFGAGQGLGARGMNKLTNASAALASQANMFGMDANGARARLQEEAIGFEFMGANGEDTPLSFRGFSNAFNRTFMTHQQMFQSTTSGIQGMLGGLGDKMSMAMDIRAAREELGPGASGVQILRKAREMSVNKTPQQKVQQMRASGFSDDVIVGRLLGQGLDEAQIQYAMADTLAKGNRDISDAEGRGQALIATGRAGRESSMALTSRQAANEFDQSAQAYGTKGRTKLTALIESQGSLERQLFANAGFTEELGKNILDLSKRYEDNAKSWEKGIEATNKLIDGINELIRRLPGLRNRTPIDKI